MDPVVLLVSLHLAISVQPTLCALLKCREGSETAISLPTTLGSFVDPGLNTATSQETSDTARDFTNGDYSFQFEVWCAGSDDPSPSVTVFFSSPVLVTALLSGGRNTQAGSLYYVNNFTLEFYNDALDDFMYYNGSECDGPKEFIVPTVNTFFHLDRPTSTDKLRFNQQDHFGINDCWNMMIFGCINNSAVEDSSLLPNPCDVTTSASSPAFSPSPTPTPIVSQMSQSPTVSQMSQPPTSARVVKDYQAVAIVLPLSTITLLLVVAIMAVGAVLYWKSRRAVVYASCQPRKDSCAERILDNSGLYHPTISTTERDRSVTIKEVTNVLYECQDEDVADCTYETVGDEPQARERGATNQSLAMNPIYTRGSDMQTDSDLELKRNNSYELAEAPPVLPPRGKNEYEDIPQ